jgi:hypothetical protein
MGRVAVLKIGNGDFDQGFDVSLQVCRDNALPSPEIPGRLPANTELEDLYTVWQQTFIRLTTQRGTDSDWQIESRPTNHSTSEVDACRYFAQNLETSMRSWLQRSQDQGWQRIRERLVRELANNSDEFRVIISAINSELCKLPWHIWDLMESNLNVEIAFSYPNDGEPETVETNSNNKVRILAVFGDSSGIDTQPDRDAISQLNGANPKFLSQPTSQALINYLRIKEGWNIFFFAGHSETNGEIGRIYINESESLEISDFRNALREAVRHGLKLAIFNSCDGLGLARQLADLHIPVIIVMREPVPDKVAQSFLRQFLTEYAHGQPLYTSVRRARERLEEFQNLPGATWLPVICQIPALVPPTWQELRRRSTRQRWLPALPIALALGLLLLFVRPKPPDIPPEIPSPSDVSKRGQQPSRKLYVCRASYNGGMHPGKLLYDKGICYIGYGGQEHMLSEYDVLTGASAARWQTAIESRLPLGAFKGGQELGRNLYVCRASYKGGIFPGKLLYDKGVCNITYGWEEFPLKNYEVLIGASDFRWQPAIKNQLPPNAVPGGHEPSHNLADDLTLEENRPQTASAGQELTVFNIKAQCKAQYGQNATEHWGNTRDAKSWKCIGVGNPKSISMSQACKRQMGDNYYAATDRKSYTGWRCVRKWSL